MDPRRVAVILAVAAALAPAFLAGTPRPALALDWCSPLAIAWGYPGVAYAGEVLEFSISLANGVDVPLDVSAITVAPAWGPTARDWGSMVIPAHGTETNVRPLALPSRPEAYPIGVTVTGAAGGGPYSDCGPFTRILTVAALPPPPRVYIQAHPSVGSSPLRVDLLATVTDGAFPLTYAWDFGDGGTATGSAASHQYSSPGTYTVQVQVVDHRSRTASAATTVTVQTPSLGEVGGSGSGLRPYQSTLALLVTMPIVGAILTTIVILAWRWRDRRPRDEEAGPPP